ncbi:hypothetical protein F7C95_17625 [Opitutia bacterium ISCC 51]|nr:hypothetical protein F7C95_17625 [Opitutae bacterium ISCC 51]QXD27792.1 hypothetical protein GA003_17530 [Opitutae bacterium ISCC 52]
MKSTALVLLFLGTAAFSDAQTGIPLLDNWPFAPPGSSQSTTTAAPEGPASLAKLQLRGITSVDGEYIFSVYNPYTRESKWLPQGVELDGLVIKSYDSKKNSVVIHSEAENLSRQMQMNDYSAPTGIRAAPRPATQASSSGTANRTTPQAVSPTGTLSRTQQTVQRPTRRNLETLRARRAELAEKLRKQPKPGDTNPTPGGTNQPNGGSQ